MDDHSVHRRAQRRPYPRGLTSAHTAPDDDVQDTALTRPRVGKHEPVADLVRSSINELSTGERRVADALLAAYPIAGLETVAQLALRAGVSSPTVLRFTVRIGFPTFSDLQVRLRCEVQESLGSPAKQYESLHDNVAPSHPAFGAGVRDLLVATIHQAFDDLPTGELQRIAETVADRGRRITLIGGRFSKILATYLGAHLQMLRLGVQVINEDELVALNSLASVRKKDLLIAYDFRRYDVEVIKFTRAHHDTGGEVLLLTDSGPSPIAAVASTVLTTPVDSVSPFDSLVPALAMTEALIAATAVLCGEQGRRRVNEFERHRDALR